MKKSMLIGISCTILFAFAGQAQESTTSKRYIFINNTGIDANDLHIEFDRTVKYEQSELTKKFGHNKAETVNGKTTLHFKNRGEGKDGSRLVKNGNAIVGDFESKSEDLRIEKWWWTRDGIRIGGEQIGDKDTERQSFMLVVPSADVVTEVVFTNKIYKGTQASTEDAVVNDLHIVLDSLPSKIINKTRKSPQDSAKFGGVFKKEETMPCLCNTLTGNDEFIRTGREPRERKREREQMPEPCKTICASSMKAKYVIHLSEPDVRLQREDSVSLHFRGENKPRIENYWWTQDRKPLLFKEKTEKKRFKISNGTTSERDVKTGEVKAGNENAPPPNETDDWKKGIEIGEPQELYMVSAPSPSAGSDLGLGIFFTNYSNKNFGAPILDKSFEQIQQDEAWFEESEYVPLFGKISNPRIRNIFAYGLEAGIGLGEWQIRPRATIAKGEMEGKILAIAPSNHTGGTVQGMLSLEWKKYQASLGLRRYFGDNHIKIFVESGILVEYLKSKEAKITLGENFEYRSPLKVKQNYIGVYFRTGFQWDFTQKLFFNASGEIQGISPLNQDKNNKFFLQPRAALTLGLKLGK